MSSRVLPCFGYHVVVAGLFLGIGLSPVGAAIRKGDSATSVQEPRHSPEMPGKADSTEGRSEAFEPRIDTTTESAKRWSVLGLWSMTHPDRRGPVQLRPDGTFTSLDGQGGRWSISGDRGGVLLVLVWADGATDSAEMLDGHHFTGRTKSGPFTLQRQGESVSSAEPGKAEGKVEITSAMYGRGDRRVDITLELRKLLKDGRLRVEAPWNFGALDPKAAEREDLIVQYRVGDRNRTARFRKNEPIVLPRE